MIAEPDKVANFYEELGKLILNKIEENKKLPIEQLLDKRYNRFRKIGMVQGK